MNEVQQIFPVLVQRLLEDLADQQDLLAFEQYMRESAQCREIYFEQVRMHAILQWRTGSVRLGTFSAEGAPSEISAEAPARLFPAAGWKVPLGGLGMLAVAALVMVLGWGIWRPQPEAKAVVGQILGAEGVVWETAATAGNGPVGIGPLAIRAGVLHLQFHCGAVVRLEGPAEISVLDPLKISVHRGRLTAHVEEQGRGFTVVTPNADVIDLGTEFGVDVDGAGRTEVVVFEGIVELTGVQPQPEAVLRLTKGEAMRVSGEGRLSRIVTVERHPEGGWTTEPSSEESAIITDVRDNIQDSESNKYYQIVRGGFADDVPSYVDRGHQWNGLDETGVPDFLRQADYVMTFNQDKRTRNLELQVSLARPCTLYLLFDKRVDPPAWLVEQFTNTGVDIGLDEGPSELKRFSVAEGAGTSVDRVFTVWSREIPERGTVPLGALTPIGTGGRAMYGIAAVGLE